MRRIARFHDLKDVIAGDRTRLSTTREGDFRWKISAVRTLRLVAHAHGHSAAAPQLRDFHVSILFMAVLALGPVFDSLGLPADAGAATSGHRQPKLEVNPA
jgi:hypothetical protein